MINRRSLLLLFAALLLPVILLISGAVFAQQKPVKTRKGKAYPVRHSEKFFFSVEDFNMENETVKITISEGYVLLGSTVKGFTEAIIIPLDSRIDGDINEMEAGCPLNHLYLRFNPEWYARNLEQNLQRSPAIDSIYSRAMDIHKQKFRNYFHAGWNALIPPAEVLICDFEMRQPVVRIGSLFYADKYYILSDPADNFDKYTHDRFTLYYPGNSVIGDTLQQWLNVRERAYANICDFLDVEQNRIENVTFYVFNDKKQGLKYGKKLGFAVPGESEIYTLYNQTPGHELAHVVSYWINTKRIDSALINEGLAVLLDQSGRNYNRITRHLLSTEVISPGELTSLLGDNFREIKWGYPVGASFVDFLIKTRGIDKFKDFFAQKDYNESDSFVQYYGKTGPELMEEWKEQIVNKDYGELSAKDKDYLSLYKQWAGKSVERR